MAPPPDVLPGPRLPPWGCRCGCADNWASRVACRQCGGPAAQKTIQAARKAAAAEAKAPATGLKRPPQGQWANGAPGNANAKMLKTIQDLQ